MFDFKGQVGLSHWEVDFGVIDVCASSQGRRGGDGEQARRRRRREGLRRGLGHVRVGRPGGLGAAALPDGAVAGRVC